MKLYATGQTFQHKELLKSLGGRWDNGGKRWLFEWGDEDTRQKLEKLIGVVVSVDTSSPEIEIFDTSSPEIETSDYPVFRLDRNTVSSRSGDTAVYGDDDRYLNYFKDQNPTAFFGFSSLLELTNYVKSIDLNRLPPARQDAWTIGKKYSEWSGSIDMREALNMARNGWEDGIKDLADIEIEHAQSKRRAKGVSGGYVNVGRLLSGDPQHMIRRVKKPGKRVVTLFVETFMSSYIEPSTAVLRARAVAAMSDALERQGYVCEIVAVLTTASRNNQTGHQAAVTLKTSGERLNMLDVVFGLGHPSFFRRLLFACVSGAEECQSTWDTQGSPTTAFDHTHPCKKNEFYIPQMTWKQQDWLEEDPTRILTFVKPRELDL